MVLLSLAACALRNRNSCSGPVAQFHRFAVVVTTLAALSGLSTSFAQQGITPELVARVKPAVVSVRGFDSAGREVSAGSGFFIGRSRIVTNYHVLEDAASATVRLASGQSCNVRGVVASDSHADLIIVEITGKGAAHLVPAASEPEVGERVLVIGAPLGLEFSVSEGLVSGIRGLKRSPTDSKPEPLLQFSAPISQGSSGSPVVNSEGCYVGVVRAGIMEAQGLNFAIPASRVADLKHTDPVAFEEWFRNDHKHKLTMACWRDPLAVLRHLPNVRTEDLHPFTLEMVAKSLMITGDYAEAIRLLQRAKARISENSFKETTDPLALRGFRVSLDAALDAAQRHASEEASAPQEYRRVCAGYRTPEWHIQMGSLFLANQRPRLALEGFRAASRLSPSDSRAFFGMGMAYLGLGRVFEARNAFADFVKLAPTDPKAHFFSGLLHASTGQFREAEHAFDTFTRLRPRSAYGFDALGSVQAHEGNWAAAEAAYSTAVRLAPLEGEYRFNLGVVYVAQGRIEQARREIASLSDSTWKDTLNCLIDGYSRTDGEILWLRTRFEMAWHWDVVFGDECQVPVKAQLLMVQFFMEGLGGG